VDLETRVAAVALLRALRDISSRRTRIAARRPPLLRSICLPELHLRTPAPHWFGAPASRLEPRLRVTRPPRGPSRPEILPVSPVWPLPQASIPLQSFTRESPCTDKPRTALSRGFSPHRRNPAVQSHHPRGFQPPGHVASSRFLPASTPCSLQTASPVCFNRARPRGSPFRA